MWGLSIREYKVLCPNCYCRRFTDGFGTSISSQNRWLQSRENSSRRAAFFGSGSRRRDELSTAKPTEETVGDEVAFWGRAVGCKSDSKPLGVGGQFHIPVQLWKWGECCGERWKRRTGTVRAGRAKERNGVSRESEGGVERSCDPCARYARRMGHPQFCGICERRGGSTALTMTNLKTKTPPYCFAIGAGSFYGWLFG